LKTAEKDAAILGIHGANLNSKAEISKSIFSLLFAALLLLSSVPQAIAGGPHALSVYSSNVTTTPVGSDPVAMVWNPTNQYLYVVNKMSNSISVIDPLHQQLIKNIPVGKAPDAIDVDPATGNIYVAYGADGVVGVIDGTTNAVVDVIMGFAYPIGIRVQSQYIYVLDSNLDSVSVIDIKTHKEITTIPTGSFSDYLIVNKYIGVVTDLSSSVDTFFDTATNAVTHAVKTVGLAAAATFVANNQVWVVGSAKSMSEIDIIDTTNFKILGNITSNYPLKDILSGYNGVVYVAEDGTGNLWGIDPTTHATVSEFKMGTNLAGLAEIFPTASGPTPAMAPNGALVQICVTDTGKNQVACIPEAASSSTTTSSTSSSSQTSTSTSNTATSTTRTGASSTSTASSSSSAGGGIPEFPYQFVALTAFTVLLAVSYLLARGRPLPTRRAGQG
jgi:YVTN family beta-propeller protein